MAATLLLIYRNSWVTRARCFKQIWKVGKVGKMSKVGRVGKVGKEGKEGRLRE